MIVLQERERLSEAFTNFIPFLNIVFYGCYSCPSWRIWQSFCVENPICWAALSADQTKPSHPAYDLQCQDSFPLLLFANYLATMCKWNIHKWDQRLIKAYGWCFGLTWWGQNHSIISFPSHLSFHHWIKGCVHEGLKRGGGGVIPLLKGRHLASSLKIDFSLSTMYGTLESGPTRWISWHPIP